MNQQLLAPSILSADFGNLQRDIEMLNNSDADWFHVDVMDGRFVPNISFGFPILEIVKKHAKKFIDVHLMIVEPEKYIPEFVKRGADQISFHIEAVKHLDRTIHQIKELGVKAGIVLNPGTPISFLEDIVTEVDLVLLMSVNPGFGGQKFVQNTFKKIFQLKDLIHATESKALIEVDGGVNFENARQLYNAGADVLVAGSAVFSSGNPTENIARLKS